MNNRLNLAIIVILVLMNGGTIVGSIFLANSSRERITDLENEVGLLRSIVFHPEEEEIEVNEERSGLPKELNKIRTIQHIP